MPLLSREPYSDGISVTTRRRGNCNRHQSMSVILVLRKSAMLIVFTDCADYKTPVLPSVKQKAGVKLF